MRTQSAIALACFGFVTLTACNEPSVEGSRVRLALHYEQTWSLDSLEIELRSEKQISDVASELLLRVPDAWAGSTLPVVVTGLRGGEPWAAGQVSVVPMLGAEVRAEVILARVPCGDWCTQGATQCVGDGVALCQQRDNDDCLEWGDPTPCSPDAPYCSLGVCRDRCFDECAAGETDCAGPGAMKTCGQIDSDPCLDWGPATACASEETCANRACTITCQDECVGGSRECRSGGIATCGDANLDGCSEWGPPAPCGEGETCEAGACLPRASCSDECSAPSCRDDSWTQCGNYDDDPCRERSPGVSCVPTDACLEGMCTTSGCQSTLRTCADAPDPVCVNDHTLRSYARTGTCDLGSCEYDSTDRECVGCPDCESVPGDAIGDACSAEAGCSEADCIENWTAGYCSKSCRSDTDCGTGAHCGTGSLVDTCVRNCTASGDCRAPAYACSDRDADSRLECVPLGTGTGVVGDPCEDTSDCRGEERAWCLGGVPGGYCTLSCSTDAATCPTGSTCIGSLCLKTCSTSADCRADGYACDTTQGICDAAGTGTGTVGSTCEDASDCAGGLSGSCRDDPGGYCTLQCSLIDLFPIPGTVPCPSGSHCVSGLGGASPIDGFCATDCATAAECRADQVCENRWSDSPLTMTVQSECAPPE